MNLDYSPVFNESGAPAGVIAIVVETTERVLTDRRLRESEERFRALTNATSDVVYRMSPDWTEMRQMDGRGFLSDTDSPSVAWLDEYVFPEDQAEVRVAVENAVRTKRTFQLEHRVRRADGSIGWAFSRAIPWLDDRGQVVEWFGAASDVTERRRAEARRDALIRLGDEIQSLDEPTDIAFAASRALGETLGVSRVGYGTVNPVDDTLTVPRDWTAPGVESIAGVLNLRDFGSFVDDLKLGAFIVISDVLGDPRTRDAAHRLISLNARSFVNVSFIEKNQMVGVFYVNDQRLRDWLKEDLSFIREVAARTRMAIGRRRAERDFQELAASLEVQVEQRTRERDRVWRNTQDLSVIIDRTGAFAAVNPATTRILGWTEEEMVGRPVSDLIAPDDSANPRGAEHWVRREGLASFQNRFRQKGGGVRWISWVAALEGDFIYASGRDITVEKEAGEALAASEAALRQSQKMEAVGQLTGGLAHDFNNILAGVQGSLDLMKIRIAQGRAGEIDRYMKAAQSSIRRAAALTHRLLAFSRRQTLDPRPTNINQLVFGMEELIRRSVGPEIAVGSVAHPDLWNVLVDAGQLENGLLNLCLNARDAMVGGGKLTIETGNKELDEHAARQLDLPAGPYVTLCVTDTGVGMTPEVVAHAFDPFFTTKPIGQGTGLGLSMIYGFVRQSGGQIKIDSEPEKGAAVCIYLPRSRAEVTVGDPEVGPSEAPVGTGAQTVLVVDDEPLLRVFVTEVLEDLGYSALEAGEGAAAMKILASGKTIDLLITDVGLPNGMNGRQLADAARQARPGLKVLFITGYAESTLTDQGRLEPGLHVITKPFATEALAKKIGALMAGA